MIFPWNVPNMISILVPSTPSATHIHTYSYCFVKYRAFKKDLEGPGALSHEYLSGWGTFHGEIIPIKRHYTSLIWKNLQMTLKKKF